MSHPPWLLKLRSSTAFIIATVWTSSFTDYFLYAMIVPVMPTALVDRANVPYDDREHWVSILLICEAAVAFVCCPIFGYLIDVAPTRQLPYLLGLILLGASMLLLSLAHTVGLFVVARLLQGGATAMVAVAGLALLTDSVSSTNLGQAIGYLGSAVALGFMLGPLLGGLVYRVAGYQPVFAMAFAIVAVDMVMRIAVIEKKVAKRWVSNEDSPSGDESQPQSQPPPDNSSDDTPKRREIPALFLLVQQPRILVSSWGLLVHGIIYAAFDATIPIFVESKFNWTPLGAGLTFLPSSLTALLEPYFGTLTDRLTPRPMATISFLLLPIPLCLLRLVTANTTPHIVLFLSLLTLTGLLMNMCIPALYLETQQVLDTMERRKPGVFGPRGAVAQAFGIQTMAQFLGLSLGPLAGVLEGRLGWGGVVTALGVVSGGTAVLMFLFMGRGGDVEGEREGEGERERLLGDGNRNAGGV
ncbi:MFS general substrate transporter [Aspergillus ellipticus CBS 707.79]|uniref:MFS general substrate transporter n=1 Tax=Aspergillus ellipticus CBS 707.79 TaxID=1448320 RepID=A0A319CV48_9EURO|nr:MFS general substrate transporter [Aspergillus ellipticus CBS 707.79]